MGNVIISLAMVALYGYIVQKLYVNNISVLLVVWYTILSFVFWWLYPYFQLSIAYGLFGYNFKNDVKIIKKIVKKNRFIFFINNFIVFCFVWLFYFVFVTLPEILLIEICGYSDKIHIENVRHIIIVLALPFGMLISTVMLIVFRKYKSKKK
jgi:hypothetical protein